MFIGGFSGFVWILLIAAFILVLKKKAFGWFSEILNGRKNKNTVGALLP